ncbi:unnamed protein product [Cylicocyclus nassatus]|uniref:Uncharacterized protein n=1 Tax=Cylicocyclus nassatus TaxID=53992 RepID=A0AA36GED1_CYLNA|nr:unnamed protein product [Cylicocyclus nassatus]
MNNHVMQMSLSSRNGYHLFVYCLNKKPGHHYQMPNKNNDSSSERASIDELKEEAKKLVKKIQDHFLAIEEHRKKDRELWRSLNRRLESLEEVKSERGKRRIRRSRKSKEGH